MEMRPRNAKLSVRQGPASQSASRKAMDVRAWLEAHNLGQYAERFASNDIDAQVLCTLTTDDLKDLGVASLGHRKKLLAAIAEFDASATTWESMPGAAPPGSYTPDHLARQASGSTSRCCLPTSKARSRSSKAPIRKEQAASLMGQSE
ncbi:SAM domain-containing protein [Bradyrhizobium sp. RDI18]|uniref:SAM domain-containing protein n=1 Tax=Bradyrhizobium sp. RDI18 TaxID=3367400 RepID=UPI00371C8D36